MSERRLKALIIDDEPLARKGIRSLLRNEPDIAIAGECADGLEAVEEIQNKRPDLVFLDVQMPGLDGFGVIEAIGVDKMPVIVFVTAYDLHALRAFQVHAIDYLLKPLNAARFREALDRARRMATTSRPDDLGAKMLDLLESVKPRGERYTERFIIRSLGRVTVLPAAEVEWIQAEGDYVELHSLHGKKHLLREKISVLEENLDPSVFVRIHRSSIVRIDRIRELRPHFNGDHAVYLQDGTRLSLSRTYRKRAFQSLEKPLRP
jgi:two-component system LytT family response regulator